MHINRDQPNVPKSVILNSFIRGVKKITFSLFAIKISINPKAELVNMQINKYYLNT